MRTRAAESAGKMSTAVNVDRLADVHRLQLSWRRGRKRLRWSVMLLLLLLLMLLPASKHCKLQLLLQRLRLHSKRVSFRTRRQAADAFCLP